jgi:hypothetical protein
MNFPDLPTNGQVFGLYTYDGEKWVFTSGPGGITQADADARYVNVTGDHMSGALIIDAATGSTSPTTGALVVGGGAGIGGAVRLNQAPGVLSVGTPLGSNAAVSVQFNPSSWSGIEISSSSTGTAAGILHVFNNAATPWSWTWAASQAAINVSGPWKYTDTTASTSPTTGALTVAGGVGVGESLHVTSAIFSDYNGIVSGAAGNSGSYYFGNAGNGRLLDFNGTQFTLTGGPLNVNNTTASSSPTTGALTVAGGVGIGGVLHASAIVSASSATVGSYYFGTSGTKYLNYDGSKFVFAGGNVWHGVPNALVDAPVAAGTNVAGAWPIGVSATDRGILFLVSGASSMYHYFTQGTTSNAVGSINGSTTATVYNTTSSGELKEDLKTFDAGNIIDDTNVYDFKWKSTGERAYGVIAQQAIDVYPLAVTHMPVETAEGENDYWGVDYSKYVPVLLQELKALRARVAQLEGRTGAGIQPARGH